MTVQSCIMSMLLPYDALRNTCFSEQAFIQNLALLLTSFFKVMITAFWIKQSCPVGYFYCYKIHGLPDPTYMQLMLCFLWGKVSGLISDQENKIANSYCITHHTSLKWYYSNFNVINVESHAHTGNNSWK